VSRALLALAFAGLVSALGAGCRLHGRERPHQPIGAAAETLRAAFNGGFGQVRVLMLVAPT
jgi:hypothetical protein